MHTIQVYGVTVDVLIFVMSAIAIDTDLGAITLALRRDAAPRTCDYIIDLVSRALYDGMSFYRSVFVVQVARVLVLVLVRCEYVIAMTRSSHS